MHEFPIIELIEDVRGLFEAFRLSIDGGKITAKKLRGEVQRNAKIKRLVQMSESLKPLASRRAFSVALETLSWRVDLDLDYYRTITLCIVVRLHVVVEGFAAQIFECLDVDKCGLVNRATFRSSLYREASISKIVRRHPVLLSVLFQPHLVRETYDEIVYDEGVDIDGDIELPEFMRLMILMIRKNECFHRALDVDRTRRIADWAMATENSGSSNWNLEDEPEENTQELLSLLPTDHDDIQATNEPERKVDSRQAQSFLDLGRYEMVRTRFAEAEKYYVECLRIDPDDKVHLFATAQALIAQHRYRDAQEKLERIAELHCLWQPAIDLWLICEDAAAADFVA